MTMLFTTQLWFQRRTRNHIIVFVGGSDSLPACKTKRIMDALRDHVLVTAWVCYEAERAYCMAHSDYSMTKPWEKLSVAKKQFWVDKVMQHAMHPNMEPRQMHETWREDMETAGFTYGDKYSEEGKTHPSLLPYDNLPWHIQVKDSIFYSIFNSLMGDVCRDTKSS